MNIKIIGRDSAMQRQLKTDVEDIIHELGLECKLDIIHHMNEILKIEEKNILLTPALIVDDKIICQGHIWAKEHIAQFMQKHCSKTERKNNNELTNKFSYWKGIPREEIDWAPIVDLNKCTGCGICVTSCGRNVFDYDWGRKKTVVARPLQCMVGCTSCKVWCVYDAIRFPDSDRIRTLIKKRGVLEVAKKDLDQRKIQQQQ
ncbi:MAG: thioredoxin family protein [Candidatus Krumholzibacteriota bacterium]|nr:thioredoxin family protein [Candidatus Krumholzibacteriota bacterium]